MSQGATLNFDNGVYMHCMTMTFKDKSLLMPLHTYTLAPTHTHTHAHTHIHTYAQFDTHTDSHKQTHTDIHMYKHTHARTRTHTHTHKHKHTHTQAHTDIHMYKHKHTHTHNEWNIDHGCISRAKNNGFRLHHNNAHGKEDGKLITVEFRARKKQWFETPT